ncbi:hypothetical protein ACFQ48_11135 [Hymenobacter caeli]|uniref:Uncharacterized protein n=1 Tax=Hymenobacter caeli TaxID=2735894 RepID=A0ABX2FRT0_9BACT|nr:hypothetical protein [Hymenobacter caeli]NRT19883.1 hypothetical protein [Hymenobacter caeli]
MKVSHRQNVAQRLASTGSDKAPRLSCCCRISELMPLVRQLHDVARAQAEARVQLAQQAA